jgi:PII-like signaling protein
MHQKQPGKLVRLHLSEGDRYEGKSLYEAIVKKCQQLDVAGVTVLRGLEGYGESSEIHRSHLLAHDQPIVVTIIETADNVNRILPELEQMLGNGIVAVSDVEVIRIHHDASTSSDRSG